MDETKMVFLYDVRSDVSLTGTRNKIVAQNLRREQLPNTLIGAAEIA